MTFTSNYFPLFLVFIVALYYGASKSAILQNAIIIIASLLFYTLGQVHYLIIWAGISLFTWLVGQAMQTFQEKKKVISIFGIVAIVSLFVILKYSKMFADIFQFSLPTSVSELQLFLPIGISFYSFTCIGYLADIYNNRIHVNSSLIQFLAYTSFFPQILSGPISFADEQLPQFEKNRPFDLSNFKEGFPFLVWGLFKKVVISNSLIKPIAYIFTHTNDLHGTTLFVGLILYSIQVYADFSGYSDMAYGIARFFGIKIPLNFRMPYFSKNIADYWKNWHTSLSKWFGRYIYIPLGGNKGSFLLHLRNVIIVFALSGLWHGANIKFILWGLLNAAFYCVFVINQHFERRESQPKLAYKLNGYVIPSMLITFLAVTIARVYFRAETWHEGNNYLVHMFNNHGVQFEVFGMKYLVLVVLFIGFEWIQRARKTSLEMTGHKWYLQTVFYTISILFIIYALQSPQQTEHIYFKY